MALVSCVGSSELVRLRRRALRLVHQGEIVFRHTLSTFKPSVYGAMCLSISLAPLQGLSWCPHVTATSSLSMITLSMASEC